MNFVDREKLIKDTKQANSGVNKENQKVQNLTAKLNNLTLDEKQPQRGRQMQVQDRGSAAATQEDQEAQVIQSKNKKKNNKKNKKNKV